MVSPDFVITECLVIKTGITAAVGLNIFAIMEYSVKRAWLKWPWSSWFLKSTWLPFRVFLKVWISFYHKWKKSKKNELFGAQKVRKGNWATFLIQYKDCMSKGLYDYIIWVCFQNQSKKGKNTLSLNQKCLFCCFYSFFHWW